MKATTKKNLTAIFGNAASGRELAGPPNGRNGKMSSRRRNRNRLYLLYRRGSNALNQPLEFDWVPVAIVRAASKARAERLSWHGEAPSIHSAPTPEAQIVENSGDVRFFADQYAKAVCQADACRADWLAVLEAAAERSVGVGR
jgi:hypothetical protein